MQGRQNAWGDFIFDLPDWTDRDYAPHNGESAALWQAFWKGDHPRVPIRLNTLPKNLILDPRYNSRGLTFREFTLDPEIMAQATLEWKYWTRTVLPGDHEKGLPAQWDMMISFGNIKDAAWFGSPVHYHAGQVPATTPILTDDNKQMLFDRGIPDPFKGEWPERALRFWETYVAKSARGWTFLGAPVAPPGQSPSYYGLPYASHDGPFTLAVSLRGAAQFCLDLALDPDYAWRLLDFLTTALIERTRAWRALVGAPAKSDNYWTSDDAVQLISTDMYRQFVLPMHRRIFNELATEKNRTMHLCGDAQRHFVTIRDGAGVSAFDVGFPIDFGRLRRELGPDVIISGGPPAMLFLEDDATLVARETERILSSGILDGGRYILQEGNVLPPRARLHVCEAFYATGKRLGRLDATSRRPFDAP